MGGIYVSGFENAPIISRCLFHDNSVERKRSVFRTLGGGAHIENQSSTSIVDCEIANNTAEIGGGVSFESCHALFLNNYVHDNQAVRMLGVCPSNS